MKNPESMLPANADFPWVVIRDRAGRAYVVSVEEITAKRAEEYLATSAGNRNEKEETVDNKYVPDLVEDRWELNGATAVFDWNGVLRDGHNRMKAIIKADAMQPGVMMPVFVIRGVKPESVVTIDSGVTRTFRDNLVMSGRGAYSPQVSVIAKAYAQYLRTGELMTVRRFTQSNAAADAVLQNEKVAEEITQAAMFLHRAAKFPRGEIKIKIDTGVYGLLFIMFARKDEALAREFFTRVFASTGDEWSHQAGDPELAFRKRMVNAYADAERLSSFIVAYMMITAWNSRHDGYQLKKSQPPDNLVLPVIADAVPVAYTRKLLVRKR